MINLSFAEATKKLQDRLQCLQHLATHTVEAGLTGSLLQTLYSRASQRAVPFFCTAVSDAAALMGTAMGLELSHPASAFALCYKTINEIQTSALTETEATAIKALNGNVYLTRGYTHLLLEKGTVSSGARYDEML